MAVAISQKVCIQRHKDYLPLDAEMHDPLQRQRLKTMRRFVGVPFSLLDVGCNSAYFADLLPAAVLYMGVDVSQAAVSAALRRLRPAFVSPAENLPFPSASFDTVLLGEILEHVFSPAAVIKEALRVAQFRVVLSTPTERSQWGSWPDHSHHVRVFTLKSLKQLLDETGMKYVVEEEGPFYFAAITPGAPF